MTEQRPVTLEEVRARFLEAESRLSEAADAVGAIQAAAERIGAAREGLGAAGAQLGNLAAALGGIATSLDDNATNLREGVDAIRAGDPAQIRQQIEELDSAFTAMQSVVGERLTHLEQQGVALSAAFEAKVATLRRDHRIVAIALAALVIASALITRLT